MILLAQLGTARATQGGGRTFARAGASSRGQIAVAIEADQAGATGHPRALHAQGAAKPATTW